MLANVQQTTIQPIIEAAVTKGSRVHTDEYKVYARLPAWGYQHKTVCHGRGEYARDEDGDGFCEVHVNTMEGFWSLLRSWLRPHRGLSQDKLPKSVQPAAKQDLREIWQAPDRATAETAIATFAEKYGAKYEKAVTCLLKDRDALLTFYDFPAEHWDHLRTSNPIESVFATVRHRTVRSKGALSQDTARLMVFKLVMAAAKTWRRLKGENQLPKVVQGVRFRDGVEVKQTPAQTAA